MAFAGLRGTNDWGTSERPQSFREYILWSQPNGPAPLFALMAKMRKESVNDPQYHWWEETLENVRVTVNDASGYSVGSTTLTIDSGGLLLKAGDVLQVEPVTEIAAYADEFVEVSSVTNDTTIVVKRGVAGTSAVGIADDVNMTLVGSAYEEGGVAATISQRNPTKKTNFTQIFKNTVGLTKTAGVTKTRTGDSWTNDKKRKSFDHARDIEWAMLLGQSNEDTSGTEPKRTTGGLREWITTNRKVYTTSPTEDNFIGQISPIFDYTGDGTTNERICMAGSGFIENLNKITRNSSSTRINFNDYFTVYGMRLQRWILPQGTIGMYQHPLMSTHPRYTNSAFFINPRGIIYRPLRDTKFEDNIQTPGKDSREAQWITECGMELHFERTMAYLGNFVV